MTTALIIIGLFFWCVIAPVVFFFRQSFRKGVENDVLKSRLQIELEAKNKSEAIDIDVARNRATLNNWLHKKDPT